MRWKSPPAEHIMYIYRDKTWNKFVLNGFGKEEDVIFLKMSFCCILHEYF